jgi:hypothetical protein
MQFQSNQPDCFKNFILSAQACNQTLQPTSGLYIENLEGITIKNLANISSEVQQTGFDLLHNKVFHAINLVKTQVQSKFAQMGWYMPLAQKPIEFCSIDGYALATSSNFRGIKVVRYDSVSPYSRFFIEKIFLRSKTSKNGVVVEIKDRNGIVLQSYTIDLVANKAYAIDANLEIAETLFYIGLSDSDLEMYSSECMGSGNCCSGSGWATYQNYYYQVVGWDGTKDDRKSYGFAIRGYLKCSINALMCQLLDPLKMAILYQTGVEILKEWLSSTRNNILTLHYDGEALANKKMEWEDEVQTQLDTVLPNLIKQIVETDKNCLLCQTQGKPKIMSKV